jgi:hypothetical protein
MPAYIDVEPVITDSTGNVVPDIETMVQTDGIYTFTYTVTNPSTATDDVAIRTVIVGDTAEAILGDDASGIRMHSAGAIWQEAKGKVGRYLGDVPPGESTSNSGVTDSSEQKLIGDMLANFGDSYNPSGLISYVEDSNGAHPAYADIAAAMADAEVNVSSLDTFTTQEGNIYDFGGYWNYNLGNSYEENHMLQDSSAELNEDDIEGDLLDVGGPHWTSINWPSMSNRTSSIGAMSGYAGNSLSDDDTKLPGTYDNSGGEACMWVTKSFGNSYEYTDGTQISVSKGHTLDVTWGGSTHIEVKYNSSGNATYWSKSSGGVTNEKKWRGNGTLIFEGTTTNGIAGDGSFIRETERHFDRNTGDVSGYSSTQATGMGKVSFEFDYTNVTSAEIKTGMVISTETYVGMKISNANYGGVKIENSNAAGAMMEFKFAPAVLKIENSKVESNIPGMVIKAKPTEMENRMSKLENDLNQVTNIMAKVSTAGANVQNQTVKASQTASIDSSM